MRSTYSVKRQAREPRAGTSPAREHRLPHGQGHHDEGARAHGDGAAVQPLARAIAGPGASEDRLAVEGSAPGPPPARAPSRSAHGRSFSGARG